MCDNNYYDTQGNFTNKCIENFSASEDPDYNSDTVSGASKRQAPELELPKLDFTGNEINYTNRNDWLPSDVSFDSLVNVKIRNSVTTIGAKAFYNCTNLESVTIPNSCNAIGVEAFRYCTNLTSVTIPDSVTRIDNGAFFECTKLQTIKVLHREKRLPILATRGGNTNWAGNIKIVGVEIGSDLIFSVPPSYSEDRSGITPGNYLPTGTLTFTVKNVGARKATPYSKDSKQKIDILIRKKEDHRFDILAQAKYESEGVGWTNISGIGDVITIPQLEPGAEQVVTLGINPPLSYTIYSFYNDIPGQKYFVKLDPTNALSNYYALEYTANNYAEFTVVDRLYPEREPGREPESTSDGVFKCVPKHERHYNELQGISYLWRNRCKEAKIESQCSTNKWKSWCNWSNNNKGWGPAAAPEPAAPEPTAPEPEPAAPEPTAPEPEPASETVAKITNVGAKTSNLIMIGGGFTLIFLIIFIIYKYYGSKVSKDDDK